MHRSLRKLAALPFLVLAGCEDRIAPPPPADHGLALTASPVDLVRLARETGSTDVFFARVHDQVPGFAGLLLDDGVPTVYLVDPTRAAAAEAVLMPFLAERGIVGRGFQVRDARFAWDVLYEGRLKARALLGLEEMNALGVSVSRNRIIVGLTPGASPDSARAMLEARGVDLETIEFEESEPVALLASLEDRYRPVLGGLQITSGGDPEACSAGFNVRWNDTIRAMVTAVHCMANPSSSAPQGSTIRQPVDGGQIGVEIARSPIYTAGCDPNEEYFEHQPICRDSDAALVAYHDSVDWSFGHIARPGGSPGQWESQYKNVSGRFWITDSHYMAFMGDTIHKVGYKTGWTFGLVHEMCVDRRDEDTIWLICQTTVSAGARGGDSGSPAFKRVGGNANVTLVGVVWGASPDSLFVYSPLLQVENDLGGYIDVITSAPTPPAGLSISGPTHILPGSTDCVWHGTVTGGTMPMGFGWNNDGTMVLSHIPYATGSHYTGGKLDGTAGPSFVLTFIADNDAGQVFENMTVTEDPNAIACIM